MGWDNPQQDAFGHTRVTSPTQLMAIRQDHDAWRSLELAEVTNEGSEANISWKKGRSSTFLKVVNEGDFSILQSLRYAVYRAGKSQKAVVTSTPHATPIRAAFVKRSNATADGSAPDPEDPPKESRQSIRIRDIRAFMNNQVALTDWSWLGVGSARHAHLGDEGVFKYLTRYLSAGRERGVYMLTPDLPIRWEIRHLGDRVITRAGAFDDYNGIFQELTFPAAETTFEAICASVDSEGGIEEYRHTRSWNTETAKTVGTAWTPIMGLRLNPLYPRKTVGIRRISLSPTSSSDIIWRLVVNPTIAEGGVEPSFQSLNGSIAQYDVAATGVPSGGVVVASEESVSGSAVNLDIANALTLTSSYDGSVQYPWYLIAKKISGGTTGVLASLTWEEY